MIRKKLCLFVLRSLSSKGSVTCQTYCTGNSFLNSHPVAGRLRVELSPPVLRLRQTQKLRYKHSEIFPHSFKFSSLIFSVVFNKHFTSTIYITMFAAGFTQKDI